MDNKHNVVELEKKLVQIILRDIMSRNGLDAEFKNINPAVAATMYEEWRHLLSKELCKQGIVESVYKPINAKEIGFWDAVTLRDGYYIGDDVE
ncbi:hypothetical protein ACE198_05000 [Neobacillus sp. KR4-4]|uniref:hypothetical protein n=1 Tax=Neobacillus sp. KR4-4 TaxID=3344872 RepID=UPI0035CA408B